MQTTPNPVKMLELQRRFDLTAAQMYKVAQVFKNYGIVRLPSGNFQVRSLSRPNQFHQVNPKHESCTCEYAATGEMCFHLAAWVYAREMKMDEWIEYCANARKQQSAEAHMRDVRENEDNAVHAQQARDSARVIAARERAARLERSARPRTEWVEEID